MHNLLHLLNRFNIQLLENLQNLGTFEIHVEIPIFLSPKYFSKLSSLQQRNIKENPFFFPRE